MDNYRNKFFRDGSAAADTKKRADLDFAQKIFLFYKTLLLPRPRTVYLRSTLAWTFFPVGFFTKARKSHVNSMQNQEKKEEEEDHKEEFTEYILYQGDDGGQEMPAVKPAKVHFFLREKTLSVSWKT